MHECRAGGSGSSRYRQQYQTSYHAVSVLLETDVLEFGKLLQDNPSVVQISGMLLTHDDIH